MNEYQENPVRELILTLAACAPMLAGSMAASAQDHSMHGNIAAVALPEACQTAEVPAIPGMEAMESAIHGMGEQQKAFMQGMMQTQDAMMKGIMAEDADIAFACGMIPHHQAAIEMAKVELQYGDNDWAKAMARKIIAAQEAEIAEMTKWIEEQTQ